ncbi:MAG: MinD/ParA family protein, partial [Victivallales bacterium]|nr:MinD/ParA family protein [Victivallales bacterium]
MDQAASLRDGGSRGAFGLKPKAALCCVAVASGKGGVGKTFVTVNLAVTYAKMGKKVLLVDADLGLANADIVLGVHTEYSMQDAIFKGRPLAEIVLHTPYGVDLIAASSGSREMVSLGGARMQLFIADLLALAAEYDVILFDCAAGIDSNVTAFLAAAPRSLIVVTPQPTALMDVYALTKIIYQNDLSRNLDLVVNLAENERQGVAVAEALNTVMQRYLSGRVELIGVLPRTELVDIAMKQRQPLVTLWEREMIAVRFRQIALSLLQRRDATAAGGLDADSLVKGLM